MHIEGFAIDGFNNIDKVEIRGSHIPNTLALLATTSDTSTDFEADIEIMGLLEGLRELISFQGFDGLGKAGAIRSISVFRDVTPAEPPIITNPIRLPFDSKTIVYSSTDRLRISGFLAERDTLITSLADGLELRSKIVVLTPPEDPTSFTTGDLVPKIPRTSPNQLPRLDSVLSSFPVSLTSAHFDLVAMNDDGSFSLEVDISTIPQNPLIPTTIWVQAIDGFDNTDPDISSFPIEVFYLPGGAPVARLTVLNFRGSGQDIQIYPPDSLPPSLLETFFVALEEVRFKLETFIPMVKAPDLSIQQFNAKTKAANLLSSVDQIRGSTSFIYSYSVLPQSGRFDGSAIAFIENGRDLFGSSVIPLIVTTAIQIDSLAPNLVTTPEDFRVTEIAPLFQPNHGSLVRIQSLTISVSFDDFLPSNGSFERSGIDTSTSSLSLAGPLLLSPDQPVNVISVPPAPGYDLSIQVLDVLKDGVYRINLKARDQVGNEHIFYSSFVFDQTPVASPLLITDPRNGSTIASIPRSGASQFVELEVRRLDVNLPKTDFQLINPVGATVALTGRVELSGSRIRQSPVTAIALNGSEDGIYQIPISVSDRAGNQLSKIHQFLLDSKAPEIDDFFPAQGTCVGPNQTVFDVEVIDRPGRVDIPIPVSGISPKSSLELVLVDSGDPTRPMSHELMISGENRLISVDDESAAVARKLAFVPTKGGLVRALNSDGSEDGKYQMQASVIDSVGNIFAQSSIFFFDTIAPDISVDGLSDGKLVGVTSGFLLDIGGKIQDRGFCHFHVEGSAYQGETTLEIEIFKLDPDTMERAAIFLPTQTISNLTKESPEFSHFSAQAGWRFTTFIPFLGTTGKQLFDAELRSKDQAGNSAKINRFFELVDRNLAIPPILYPPEFSIVDDQPTTFRTPQEILVVRWQNLRGTDEVELEIFRNRISSVVPFISVTYPSHLQESAPLSLSNTLPIEGLETFSLRIRGRDGDGLVTEWSALRQFEIDKRPFQVADTYLLQGPSRLALSEGQAFLISNEIRLEVLLNKRFKREDEGFFSIRNPSEGEDLELKSEIPSSLLTNQFFLSSKFDLPARRSYPRRPFLLTISNFKDRVDRALLPYQIQIPVDFGPEPNLKMFNNPVNTREITAVVRFLSAFGRLEKIKVKREGNKLISPAFILRKGDFKRPLEPTPIEESSGASGALAHTFSIPLHIDIQDTGFYYLEMYYEDQVSRSHFKEREISVGRFIASKGLIMDAPSAGLRLNSKTKSAVEGLVYLVGDIRPMMERSGEIELLQDLEIIAGTDNTLGQQITLDLSGAPFTAALTSAQVFERKSNGLEFSQSFIPSNTRLLIGSRYVLGRDVVAPDVAWAGKTLLAEGYQKLPIVLSDQGSGIEDSSIEVHLGMDKLKINANQGEIWADLKGDDIEKELSVSVRDRSGLQTSLRQNIQVIRGWGLRSAQMVPNPIRFGQRAHLSYFVEGFGAKLTAKFYDASGALIMSLEGPAEPGRNRLEWETTDRDGRLLGNGVYFFRLMLEGNGRKAMRSGKFALLR